MKLKLAKQLKVKLNSSQSDQGTNRPMVRDSHKLMPVGALIGFAILVVAISAPAYAADYTYSIIYDDNVVSNMPTDVNDGKAVGGSFSLANNTPARSGYKFLGWCNTLPSTTDNTDSCSGTTYQSSAGITITSATNFHFYAMWKEKTNYCNGSSYDCMQDFTLSTCQTKASSTNATVIDSRDGKTYTVRYINGACWMTQDLAIGPGTAMTKDDTNIAGTYTSSSPYILPGTGYDLRDNGASSDDNCSGSINGRTNACTHLPDDTDVSNANSQYTKQQLGAWYNYAAATAGTITGTSNSTVDTYNICPKGWTLPASGTGTGRIGSIGSTYKDAFSPLYGGYYRSGGLNNARTYGAWWSASAYAQYGRYSLNYNKDDLSSSNYNRENGLYVRCVRTS